MRHQISRFLIFCISICLKMCHCRSKPCIRAWLSWCGFEEKSRFIYSTNRQINIWDRIICLGWNDSLTLSETSSRRGEIYKYFLSDMFSSILYITTALPLVRGSSQLCWYPGEISRTVVGESLDFRSDPYLGHNWTYLTMGAVSI